MSDAFLHPDRLFPSDQAGALPVLSEIYFSGAAVMQGLAKGQGVVVAYYPSGLRGKKA
jgi:hypothetical protein